MATPNESKPYHLVVTPADKLEIRAGGAFDGSRWTDGVKDCDHVIGSHDSYKDARQALQTAQDARGEVDRSFA